MSNPALNQSDLSSETFESYVAALSAEAQVRVGTPALEAESEQAAEHEPVAAQIQVHNSERVLRNADSAAHREMAAILKA